MLAMLLHPTESATYLASIHRLMTTSPIVMPPHAGKAIADGGEGVRRQAAAEHSHAAAPLVASPPSKLGEADSHAEANGVEQDEEDEGHLLKEMTQPQIGGGVQAETLRDPNLLPPDAASLMYASTMANRWMRWLRGVWTLRGSGALAVLK